MRRILHTIGTVWQPEHTRSYGRKSGDGAGDAVTEGEMGDVQWGESPHKGVWMHQIGG